MIQLFYSYNNQIKRAGWLFSKTYLSGFRCDTYKDWWKTYRVDSKMEQRQNGGYSDARTQGKDTERNIDFVSLRIGYAILFYCSKQDILCMRTALLARYSRGRGGFTKRN